MSDYVLQATWNTKDALATGQSLKAVSATELGTEFSAIATAITSKYDSADIASQAQAEAGTNNATIMTPIRAQQWGTNWAGENAGIIADLQALADPGVDKFIGWDESANAAIGFTIGDGLESNGTDIFLSLGELTITAIASGDFIPFYDITGSANGVTTVANLEAGLQISAMADYDANDNIDHTAVSVSTTAPLSGGGTIAANRTHVFDISGLSALTSATLAAADTFLVDDGDGGTNKKIAWQSIGPSIAESSTAGTLALTDGNTLFVNTGTVEDTITVPDNSAVAFPEGTQIGIVCQSTAAVLVAAPGTASVVSLNGNLQVKASGGGAYLVKTGTDVWSLIGDLEA